MKASKPVSDTLQLSKKLYNIWYGFIAVYAPMHRRLHMATCHHCSLHLDS